MADDRDRLGASTSKHTEHLKGDRVIGRGMTSPDSTQMPLRAEDGEPDMDAVKGRIPPDDEGEKKSDSRR